MKNFTRGKKIYIYIHFRAENTIIDIYSTIHVFMIGHERIED